MESKINQKIDNNSDSFRLSKEKLKKYYENFFPYELIYLWLDKKLKKSHFNKREFAFTDSENKYMRYLSFNSDKDLKKRILTKIPEKVDIGAVYNIEPKKHFSGNSKQVYEAVGKELVFDIDISDYDDVRVCCGNNDICEKCWKYLIVGARCLERILNEDFGFEKIFYVFSGRRGIHCWVDDDRSFVLKNNGRSAIARYINYVGVMDMKFCNNFRHFAEPVHPSYLSAVSIIQNYFPIVLQEQDLLNCDKGKDLLRKIIGAYFNVIDMDYINEILDKDNLTSLQKIKKLTQFLEAGEKILKSTGINFFLSNACINEFMMNILFPRIDINVSIQINHLLKCPFSVHPKTGYVSIPLSIDLLENLTFDDIPHLNFLIDNNINEENHLKNMNNFNKFIVFFKKYIENK